MSRTETKGERKRTTTTKQNTSNSSYLVEEVTPQILSLGTKPFFLCSGMKIEFLLSTGIKQQLSVLFSFVCLFWSKMRANKCFLNPFAQLVFDVPRQ